MCRVWWPRNISPLGSWHTAQPQIGCTPPRATSRFCRGMRVSRGGVVARPASRARRARWRAGVAVPRARVGGHSDHRERRYAVARPARTAVPVCASPGLHAPADGTRLMSGSRDTCVRLWDTATAKMISHSRLAQNVVRAIGMRGGSGRGVVSVSCAQVTCMKWIPGSGEELVAQVYGCWRAVWPGGLRAAAGERRPPAEGLGQPSAGAARRSGAARGVPASTA